MHAVFPTSDAARRRSAKDRGGKAAPLKRPAARQQAPPGTVPAGGV